MIVTIASLNRTNVELKLLVVVGHGLGYVGLNRTNVELKRFIVVGFN